MIMKKIFMILACCMTFVGCGGNNNSPTPAYSEEQEETTTEGTIEETEESNNLYESERLFTRIIGDIEYKIPESWSKFMEETDDGVCYSYDDSFIWSCKKEYTNMSKFSDFLDDEKNIELEQFCRDSETYLMKLKFGGANWKERENIKEEYIEVSNENAFLVKSSIVRNDGNYFSETISFGSYNTIYGFTIFGKLEDQEKLDKEFGSLINSIIINESSKQKSEEIFENLKKELNESSNKLESNNSTFITYKQLLENSYYDIIEFTSFTDVSETDENHNKFVEFSASIAYFDTHFDDESIGKAIGETGWEAIKSLILEDGEFTNKMDKLRRTYELVDTNHLFKEKYESGQYKVGNDIPEGEYVMFTDYVSGYFGLTSDANGNDIIANENFDYNSIISIKDGEYLELSNCYAVSIEEVEKLPIDKANMFKIGTHLSPGEYKVISDGDRGYYCIYGDDRQDDIVANDNFSGQSYITVSDGQYLVLSHCHIEQ